MSITPETWRQSFRVNNGDVGPDGDDQTHLKSVVLDNGNILMVWKSNSADTTDGLNNALLIGGLFDSLGNQIGAQTIVGKSKDLTAANFELVALNDGKFAIATNYANQIGFPPVPNTESRWDIFGTDEEGIDLVGNGAIIDAGTGAANDYDPAISANADGSFIVAINDQASTGFYDTKITFVSANGTPSSSVSSPFLFYDEIDSMALARLSNGNHVLAASVFDPFTLEFGVYFNLIAANGTLIGGNIQVGGTTANSNEDISVSVAALTNGGFVVAWREDDALDRDIRFQLFDNAGFADGPVQFVGNTGGSDNNYEPEVVALAGGGFVIAYTKGATDQIVGQRFDDDGLPVGSDFVILQDLFRFGFVGEPSIAALDDGRFIAGGTYVTTITASINANVFAAIFDPRDDPNGSPAYTTGQVIGTIFNDELVVGNGDRQVYGWDGDDTFYFSSSEQLVAGAVFDGGDDNDTLSNFMTVGPDVAEYAFGSVELRSFERVMLDLDFFENSMEFHTAQIGSGLAFDAEIDGQLTSSLTKLIFQLDDQADGDISTLQFDADGGYELSVIGNDLSNAITGDEVRAADLIGGLGNDRYYISNSGDEVIEDAGSGYDIVYTDVASYTLTSNVERLIFTDAGNHVGKGNELDNRLNGNSGIDRFIIDEGGADIFSGGNGRDSFDARSSDEGIRVYLNNQALNGGATTGDQFASIELLLGSSTADDIMRAGDGRARFAGSGGDDRLFGGNNIDYLQGDAGEDDLRGGNARDTLIGGIGDDDLRGGKDRDQFRFVSEDFGQDTIHDWEQGLDYLRFFSAVADSFSDFTITGNGTSSARVTLNSDTSNFIDIAGDAGSVVSLDAGDFTFY
ncbi:calcium-binding protein [Pseudahrensia aquimaris]|uniref:Calcium-binding protein n=1 Tax=Pseudahrensia aquimaris TaxID=744461 RepID=A0ABW3FCR7_9HYPH